MNDNSANPIAITRNNSGRTRTAGPSASASADDLQSAAGALTRHAENLLEIHNVFAARLMSAAATLPRHAETVRGAVATFLAALRGIERMGNSRAP